MRLCLKFGTQRLEVDLLDTPTAKALIEALPFESRAQTWGEEVYFATPVKATLEKDARQGDAIALPYGRTPISTDERPKLASRCNVLGKLEGNPRELAKVQPGERVTVSKG